MMEEKEIIDKLTVIKDNLGWKNTYDKDTMEFVIKQVMDLIDMFITMAKLDIIETPSMEEVKQ